MINVENTLYYLCNIDPYNIGTIQGHQVIFALTFYIKVFIAIVCCVSVRKISEISDKMSHEGSNLD